MGLSLDDRIIIKYNNNNKIKQYVFLRLCNKTEKKRKNQWGAEMTSQ